MCVERKTPHPLTREELFQNYVMLERQYQSHARQTYEKFGIQHVTFHDQSVPPLALPSITPEQLRSAIFKYDLGQNQARMVGQADIQALIGRALETVRDSAVIVGVGTLGQVVDSGLVVLPNVADCLAIVAQVTSGEHAGTTSSTHWPIHGEAYGAGSPGQSLELVRQTIDALMTANRATPADTINLFMYGLEHRKHIYLHDMGYKTGQGTLDLSTDIPRDPNKIKKALEGYQVAMSWKMMKLGSGADDITKTAYTVFLPAQLGIEPVVKTTKTA